MIAYTIAVSILRAISTHKKLSQDKKKKQSKTIQLFTIRIFTFSSLLLLSDN